MFVLAELYARCHVNPGFPIDTYYRRAGKDPLTLKILGMQPLFFPWLSDTNLLPVYSLVVIAMAQRAVDGFVDNHALISGWGDPLVANSSKAADITGDLQPLFAAIRRSFFLSTHSVAEHNLVNSGYICAIVLYLVNLVFLHGRLWTAG